MQKAKIIQFKQKEIRKARWYAFRKQAPVDNSIVITITKDIIHDVRRDAYWYEGRLYGLMGEEIDIREYNYWKIADIT